MGHARPRALVAAALVVALAGVRPAHARDLALPAHMDDTIRRHDPQLRRCYTRALRSEPGLRGKLVLRFRVAASGRTRDVAFVTAARTLRHPAIERCVGRVFRTMRFRPLAAAGWFRTPLVFVGA